MVLSWSRTSESDSSLLGFNLTRAILQFTVATPHKTVRLLISVGGHGFRISRMTYTLAASLLCTPKHLGY